MKITSVTVRKIEKENSKQINDVYKWWHLFQRWIRKN